MSCQLVSSVHFAKFNWHEGIHESNSLPGTTSSHEFWCQNVKSWNFAPEVVLQKHCTFPFRSFRHIGSQSIDRPNQPSIHDSRGKLKLPPRCGWLPKTCNSSRWLKNAEDTESISMHNYAYIYTHNYVCVYTYIEHKWTVGVRSRSWLPNTPRTPRRTTTPYSRY